MTSVDAGGDDLPLAVINLGSKNGITLELPIYHGDDPVSLAQQFTAYHALNPRIIPKLATNIEETIACVLQRKQEEDAVQSALGSNSNNGSNPYRYHEMNGSAENYVDGSREQCEELKDNAANENCDGNEDAEGDAKQLGFYPPLSRTEQYMANTMYTAAQVYSDRRETLKAKIENDRQSKSIQSPYRPLCGDKTDYSDLPRMSLVEREALFAERIREKNRAALGITMGVGTTGLGRSIGKGRAGNDFAGSLSLLCRSGDLAEAEAECFNAADALAPETDTEMEKHRQHYDHRQGSSRIRSPSRSHSPNSHFKLHRNFSSSSGGGGSNGAGDDNGAYCSFQADYEQRLTSRKSPASSIVIRDPSICASAPLPLLLQSGPAVLDKAENNVVKQYIQKTAAKIVAEEEEKRRSCSPHYSESLYIEQERRRVHSPSSFPVRHQEYFNAMSGLQAEREKKLEEIRQQRQEEEDLNVEMSRFRYTQGHLYASPSRAVPSYKTRYAHSHAQNIRRYQVDGNMDNDDVNMSNMDNDDVNMSNVDSSSKIRLAYDASTYVNVGSNAGDSHYNSASEGGVTAVAAGGGGDGGGTTDRCSTRMSSSSSSVTMSFQERLYHNDIAWRARSKAKTEQLGERLADEKNKQEDMDIYLAPKLSTTKSRLYQQPSVSPAQVRAEDKRRSALHAQHKEWLEELRDLADKRKSEECTFKPHISQRSALLAEKRLDWLLLDRSLAEGRSNDDENDENNKRYTNGVTPPRHHERRFKEKQKQKGNNEKEGEYDEIDEEGHFDRLSINDLQSDSSTSSQHDISNGNHSGQNSGGSCESEEDCESREESTEPAALSMNDLLPGVRSQSTHHDGEKAEYNPATVEVLPPASTEQHQQQPPVTTTTSSSSSSTTTASGTATGTGTSSGTRHMIRISYAELMMMKQKEVENNSSSSTAAPISDATDGTKVGNGNEQSTAFVPQHSKDTAGTDTAGDHTIAQHSSSSHCIVSQHHNTVAVRYVYQQQQPQPSTSPQQQKQQVCDAMSDEPLCSVDDSSSSHWIENKKNEAIIKSPNPYKSRFKQRNSYTPVSATASNSSRTAVPVTSSSSSSSSRSFSPGASTKLSTSRERGNRESLLPARHREWWEATNLASTGQLGSSWGPAAVHQDERGMHSPIVMEQTRSKSIVEHEQGMFNTISNDHTVTDDKEPVGVVVGGVGGVGVGCDGICHPPFSAGRGDAVPLKALSPSPSPPPRRPGSPQRLVVQQEMSSSSSAVCAPSSSAFSGTRATTRTGSHVGVNTPSKSTLFNSMNSSASNTSQQQQKMGKRLVIVDKRTGHAVVKRAGLALDTGRSRVLGGLDVESGNNNNNNNNSPAPGAAINSWCKSPSLRSLYEKKRARSEQYHHQREKQEQKEEQQQQVEEQQKQQQQQQEEEKEEEEEEHSVCVSQEGPYTHDEHITEYGDPRSSSSSSSISSSGSAEYQRAIAEVRANHQQQRRDDDPSLSLLETLAGTTCCSTAVPAVPVPEIPRSSHTSTSSATIAVSSSAVPVRVPQQQHSQATTASPPPFSTTTSNRQQPQQAQQQKHRTIVSGWSNSPSPSRRVASTSTSTGTGTMVTTPTAPIATTAVLSATTTTTTNASHHNISSPVRVTRRDIGAGKTMSSRNGSNCSSVVTGWNSGVNPSGSSSSSSSERGERGATKHINPVVGTNISCGSNKDRMIKPSINGDSENDNNNDNGNSNGGSPVQLSTPRGVYNASSPTCHSHSHNDSKNINDNINDNINNNITDDDDGDGDDNSKYHSSCIAPSERSNSSVGEFTDTDTTRVRSTRARSSSSSRVGPAAAAAASASSSFSSSSSGGVSVGYYPPRASSTPPRTTSTTTTTTRAGSRATASSTATASTSNARTRATTSANNNSSNHNNNNNNTRHAHRRSSSASAPASRSAADNTSNTSTGTVSISNNKRPAIWDRLYDERMDKHKEIDFLVGVKYAKDIGSHTPAIAPGTLKIVAKMQQRGTTTTTSTSSSSSTDGDGVPISSADEGSDERRSAAAAAAARSLPVYERLYGLSQEGQNVKEELSRCNVAQCVDEDAQKTTKTLNKSQIAATVNRLYSYAAPGHGNPAVQSMMAVRKQLQVEEELKERERRRRAAVPWKTAQYTKDRHHESLSDIFDVLLVSAYRSKVEEASGKEKEKEKKKETPSSSPPASSALSDVNISTRNSSFESRGRSRSRQNSSITPPPPPAAGSSSSRDKERKKQLRYLFSSSTSRSSSRLRCSSAQRERETEKRQGGKVAPSARPSEEMLGDNDNDNASAADNNVKDQQQDVYKDEEESDEALLHVNVKVNKEESDRAIDVPAAAADDVLAAAADDDDDNNGNDDTARVGSTAKVVSDQTESKQQQEQQEQQRKDAGDGEGDDDRNSGEIKGKMMKVMKNQKMLENIPDSAKERRGEAQEKQSEEIQAESLKDTGDKEDNEDEDNEDDKEALQLLRDGLLDLRFAQAQAVRCKPVANVVRMALDALKEQQQVVVQQQQEERTPDELLLQKKDQHEQRREGQQRGEKEGEKEGTKSVFVDRAAFIAEMKRLMAEGTLPSIGHILTRKEKEFDEERHKSNTNDHDTSNISNNKRSSSAPRSCSRNRGLSPCSANANTNPWHSNFKPKTDTGTKKATAESENSGKPDLTLTAKVKDTRQKAPGVSVEDYFVTQANMQKQKAAWLALQQELRESKECTFKPAIHTNFVRFVPRGSDQVDGEYIGKDNSTIPATNAAVAPNKPAESIYSLDEQEFRGKMMCDGASNYRRDTGDHSHHPPSSSPTRLSLYKEDLNPTSANKQYTIQYKLRPTPQLKTKQKKARVNEEEEEEEEEGEGNANINSGSSDGGAGGGDEEGSIALSSIFGAPIISGRGPAAHLQKQQQQLHSAAAPGPAAVRYHHYRRNLAISYDDDDDKGDDSNNMSAAFLNHGSASQTMLPSEVMTDHLFSGGSDSNSRDRQHRLQFYTMLQSHSSGKNKTDRTHFSSSSSTRGHERALFSFERAHISPYSGIEDPLTQNQWQFQGLASSDHNDNNNNHCSSSSSSSSSSSGVSDAMWEMVELENQLQLNGGGSPSSASRTRRKKTINGGSDSGTTLNLNLSSSSSTAGGRFGRPESVAAAAAAAIIGPPPSRAEYLKALMRQQLYDV